MKRLIQPLKLIQTISSLNREKRLVRFMISGKMKHMLRFMSIRCRPFLDKRMNLGLGKSLNCLQACRGQFLPFRDCQAQKAVEEDAECLTVSRKRAVLLQPLHRYSQSRAREVHENESRRANAVYFRLISFSLLSTPHYIIQYLFPSDQPPENFHK